MLVAPTGHSLAVKKIVERTEIAGASLILMADGHCLRDQAIDVCAVAGAPPNTSVTAASLTTLTRMVESGLGATLLPASALRAEVHPEQDLITRSFAEPVPGRTLTLQWRSTSPDSAWFLEVCDVLRQHYLEMNDAMPDVAGPRPTIRSVG